MLVLLIVKVILCKLRELVQIVNIGTDLETTCLKTKGDLWKISSHFQTLASQIIVSQKVKLKVLPSQRVWLEH